MANLNVIITEEITLPNRNIEKTSNTKVISGINQIVRRIDTIVSTFSGSGIEIIKFSDSEEQQTAGSFVKSDVKYIRITHIFISYSVCTIRIFIFYINKNRYR
jgi:hypothetical protein